MAKPTAIDDYINTFPEPAREILAKIRAIISDVAPEAAETIKYGIPTFVLRENLVHFGGYKNHIGFYPTPSAIEAFKEALSRYQFAKGSIKFPLDQPIPFDLIEKMVRFRVKELTSKS